MTRQPPHILISDIGLPGESGYDLIRKVRQLPRHAGGDVPALALTAYAHPEDAQLAIDPMHQEHPEEFFGHRFRVSIVERSRERAHGENQPHFDFSARRSLMASSTLSLLQSRIRSLPAR